MDYAIQEGIIDSHFHGLIMAERDIGVVSLLRELFDQGFAGGIDVSVSPEDLPERRKLYAEFPRVLLSSGIHPGQCGRSDVSRDVALLEAQLADPAVRDSIAAIGEIGLDWFRGKDYREEQLDLFRRQLHVARSAGLPVIIHNREADSDVLACVDEVGSVPGVMHCFSSDVEFAKRCLDRGFSISFAGNVTYKRSEEIRRALSFVPADRLLLETDSPFLAPQAVRGRTNHPGFVEYVYEFAAKTRGCRLRELIESVNKNFVSLFRL